MPFCSRVVLVNTELHTQMKFMTDRHWDSLDLISESRTCTIGIRSWVVKKLGKTNHPAPTASWCDLSAMLQAIIYLMNTAWPWPRGALLLEDLFQKWKKRFSISGINFWSKGANKWRQGLFDLDPIRGKAIGWPGDDSESSMTYSLEGRHWSWRTLDEEIVLLDANSI